ncbi:MAG: hypothetical protein ACRC1K_00235, partial [Planctomycetia bacterium]
MPEDFSVDRTDADRRLLRWRLVMGESAGPALGCTPIGVDAQRDRALGFLYDREYGAGRNVRKTASGAGGLGPSAFLVPEWINAVQTLFPKETIERLEKDALERYHIDEMVTNPDVLARAQPNPTLLKAILTTKHLMNEAVLAAARVLVAKVVADLVAKLAREIQ